MNELSLSTWASIAEIIGAGTIVTGLIAGWVQIVHLRKQQRDAVAINLAQTFYSPDLAASLALIQPLPNDISLAELRELGDEHMAAALLICTSFETMGLLANKRIAPLELVIDLAGGIVGVMAIKLRRWCQDIRDEQDQPSFGEWFEWLGDQALSKKAQSEPAHIRLKGEGH